MIGDVDGEEKTKKRVEGKPAFYGRSTTLIWSTFMPILIMHLMHPKENQQEFH